MIHTYSLQVVFSQCVRSGGDYALTTVVPSTGISSCGLIGSDSLAYSGGFGLNSGLGVCAGVSDGFAGAGLSATNIQSIATSGGSLPIQSLSAVAPSGLSVASENVFEGPLNVIGELPFLSAVALEGVLPSGGSGIVHYGCGNGVTAIKSETYGSAGAAGLGSAAFGNEGIGYGLGLSTIRSGTANLGHFGGHTCGCGLY